MRALIPVRGFILRRLLQVVPTVLGIVVVGFILIHLAPGDPVVALAGDHGDAEYYASMRQRYHLDQPLSVQLATYFERVAAGDFGFSYVHGRPTLDVIRERAPATLLLTGTALVLALAIAVPLGALAAHKPHGARDLTISGLSLALYSAPVFWIGQLALLLLAVRLGVLPVQGMTSARSDASGGGAERALDIARHLVLPALVLAGQELAVFARLTRAAMLDELTRDYVRTARAKGVSERAVVLRHALPRALLPVVAVTGSRLGHLVAGAVVVELVFGWPGIGRLMLASLQTRDAPILLGLFFVVSFSVVLANLASDITHAAIDPRVRQR